MKVENKNLNFISDYYLESANDLLKELKRLDLTEDTIESLKEYSSIATTIDKKLKKHNSIKTLIILNYEKKHNELINVSDELINSDIKTILEFIDDEDLE